jgi:hypothetical protein
MPLKMPDNPNPMPGSIKAQKLSIVQTRFNNKNNRFIRVNLFLACAMQASGGCHWGVKCLLSFLYV